MAAIEPVSVLLKEGKDTVVVPSELDLKQSAEEAYPEGRERKRLGNDQGCNQSCQIDSPAGLLTLQSLQMIPQAELRCHTVCLRRPQDVAQQSSIVGVPVSLLQAALHGYPHDLPL